MTTTTTLLLVLGAASLAVACEPKCLKGHTESRLVKGHYEDQGFPVQIGDIQIWMPNDVWIHDHYTDVFVCDQYQVEQPAE
jgi:hypothetical protein